MTPTTWLMHQKRMVGAICIACIVVTTNSLSSPSPPSSLQRSSSSNGNENENHQPIRKIAVIGGGIAGLSLAHAFENNNGNNAHNIHVTCFDARPELDVVAGAGVQLNGGMAVLKQISPSLQRAVADAALPLTTVRSKTTNWISSNEEFQLLQFNLRQMIMDAGGDTTKALIQEDGEVMAYSIMRGALQEVLLEELKTTPVHLGKKVVDVECQKTELRDAIYLTFQDGTREGPYDMVVGCDGVNSVVKQYINGNMRSPSDNQRNSPAVYSGIRIRYAVQDVAKEDSDSNSGSSSDNGMNKPAQDSILQQHFGNGAYCLTGNYGNGIKRGTTRCCFIIFRNALPFSKPAVSADDENVAWKVSSEAERIQQQMQQQIDDAKIPTHTTRPIIDNADRFFELGIYFHNPFTRWTKAMVATDGNRNRNGSTGADKAAVLTVCGDAAHAMPPFLGQGANQAIQDAYCLANAIRQYNMQYDEQADGGNRLEDILQTEYKDKRWSTTTGITAKAGLLGYLEASSGPLAKFRDVFFFTMDKTGVAKKIFLDAAVPRI